MFWRRSQAATPPEAAPHNPAADYLVKVDLKTLIQLAKPATSLRLQPPNPKALQTGGYISRFKGRGMEFDEARLYQPGDDIRRIDWKVTARIGAPHTKIFREERERPIFIAVDNRPNMHFATRGVFKSVQAAKLAALLAWAAQQQGDRIGGQLFSAQHCQEIKPQNGKHGVLRFLNLLTQTPPAADSLIPEYTFEHVLQRLVQHARPGSRVYLISDFRGFNAKAEQHLSKLAKHCDVELIMVYDPLESQLPNKGRYRFTNQQRELIVDTTDKQRVLSYQQRFIAQQQHLEQFAQKTGLKFLSCDTACDPLSRLR